MINTYIWKSSPFIFDKMQEKEQYICPECEAVDLRLGDTFCDIQSSNHPEGVTWFLIYDNED